MKTRMILSVLIAIATMAISSAVSADTYIVHTSHQDAMMNVEAQDDTSVTWMGDGVSRTDVNEQSIIINKSIGSLYMVDHSKKEYYEIPLADLGNFEKLMGMGDMDEDEAAAMRQQMQAMMSMMKVDLTVTPTEETSEIKGWKCKKYVMDMKMGMANIKSEAWVTQDVKVDWATFQNTANMMMLMMPGADKVMEEFKKVDGLPVVTTGVANVMGKEIKTTSEVLKVETKDAPAGTYDLPKGYKKEDFDMSAGMR